MRKLHELTLYQKQYAEKHINLVYRFLHDRMLPIDEYYDIVIFGYLAAVQEYDEKPDLAKRFQFTTIAWQQMSDYLNKHFASLNRPMRKAIIVSLQQAKDTLSLDEMLPDRKCNVQDTAANRQYLAELISHLTQKEREVVILKSRGMTNTEIASQCGISIFGVYSRFTRLRQRLNHLLSV